MPWGTSTKNNNAHETSVFSHPKKRSQKIPTISHQNLYASPVLQTGVWVSCDLSISLWFFSLSTYHIPSAMKISLWVSVLTQNKLLWHSYENTYGCWMASISQPCIQSNSKSTSMAVSFSTLTKIFLWMLEEFSSGAESFGSKYRIQGWLIDAIQHPYVFSYECHSSLFWVSTDTHNDIFIAEGIWYVDREKTIGILIGHKILIHLFVTTGMQYRFWWDSLGIFWASFFWDGKKHWFHERYCFCVMYPQGILWFLCRKWSDVIRIGDVEDDTDIHHSFRFVSHTMDHRFWGVVLYVMFYVVHNPVISTLGYKRTSFNMIIPHHIQLWYDWMRWCNISICMKKMMIWSSWSYHHSTDPPLSYWPIITRHPLNLHTNILI